MANPARTTPRRAIGLSRLRWSWAVWLVPLILAAGLYFWTATSGGNGGPLAGEKTDYYNLLADGFRSGHLYLPVKPAPELLALPNPYDPAANAPYRLHDASLYEGRYYLYFGPAPALLLFLPWSLLPLGGDLPGNLAAALFAVLGLAATLALLRFMLRRWLPDTPRWMVATAATALGLTSVAPFVLRRPAVYEQAITAGYFFTAAAAWLLVSGLYAERRSLRRIGLGSLCAGLAVGCRPNLALLGWVLLLVTALLWRGGLGRVRAAAIALGPYALCGVALALYNVARFGDPLELGQSYQLAGIDPAAVQSFSLAYLPVGLFFYLLAPARHDIVFPFIHISPPPHYPGTVPASYIGLEPVGGLFTNQPLVLLAFAAFAAPWYRRLGLDRALGRVIAVCLVCGLGLVFFISVWQPGATERYKLDFAWMFVLPALVVWLALAGRASGKTRRVIQAAGVALIAWAAAYAVAISLTGYYDSLKTGSPGTYRALANLGGPLQTAAAIVAGKPLMLEVNGATLEARGPGERYLSSATILKSGQVAGPVEVQVVSPSARTVHVLGGLQQAVPGTRLRVGDGSGAPVVDVGGGVLDVRVRLQRGLNALRLTALAPSGGGAPGDVRITDLRLR